MLHQEQYRNDPFSLKSLYIMHHLTLQRLCEHSLALGKLTFCPLKDYHCDRIDKTLLCLVLAVSYFIIFTNRDVRRCRWVDSAAHRPTLVHQASYQIPYPPSFIQYVRSQLRGVGLSSPFPIHLGLIDCHASPGKKERETKTQRTKKHSKCVCGKLCERSIFNTALLPVCVSHCM